MSSEDLYDRTISTGSVYHIFNRGVAKQPIFQDHQDYYHLQLCLKYYLDDDFPCRMSYLLKSKTKTIEEHLAEKLQKPLVLIHSNCLMPNHFHFIVEQLIENGISTWLRRSLNSFTRYYNVRHNRVGPMFQGPFRFVSVNSDNQFLHLSRYIYNNPVVAKLVAKPEEYLWSSYSNCLKNKKTRLCDPNMTLDLAGSIERYKEFVNDRVSYTTDFDLIKSIILE